MKSFLSTLTFILWATLTWAQLPTVPVPPVVQFADVTLSLSPGARERISHKVNSLMKSERHFMEYVSRCDRYFPYIEAIFAEENIPDDFKYLALQESALLPYAISSANAVGFWQFKDFTALENGMRVDNVIDQRKNIVSATYGAASYLRKNNNVLDNWLYTLLSYNLGLTGAKRTVREQELLARHITLDKNSHQYIIHFLAHKIAFEHYVGRRENTPTVQLLIYPNVSGKSISSIAKETKINEATIRDHNYWLLKGKVPSDQDYYFILPVEVNDIAKYKQKHKLLDASDIFGTPRSQDYYVSNEVEENTNDGFEYIFEGDAYPDLQSVEVIELGGIQVVRAFANGLPAIIAQKGQKLQDISKAVGVSISKLRKYNELEKFDELQAGQIYYLKRKRRKGLTDFFTVTEDKGLWMVSQRLGIRKKKLVRNNRMLPHELIKKGRVLWLKKRRPSSAPIEYEEIEEETVEGEVITQEPSNDSQKEEDTILRVEEDVEEVDLNATYHTVKTDENLLSISRLYNVTIIDLRAWNKDELGEDGGVAVGQKIRVKAPSNFQKDEPTGNAIFIEEVENEVLADGTIIHIVRDGEDLNSIAAHYEVKSSKIIMWNSLQSRQVKKGDKLIVKPMSSNSIPSASEPKEKVEETIAEEGEKTTAPKQEENNVVEKPKVNAKDFHIVQTGDTFYGIARKYNKKPADLMRLNPNLNPSSLSLGSKVYLTKQGEKVTKPKTEEIAKPNYHIVKRGETLSAISRKYNISAKEIVAINKLKNVDDIKAGQKLLIRSSKEKTEDEIASEAIPDVKLDDDGTYVVAEGANTKWHTIQKGETLYSISRKYKVSTKQLQAWNEMNGASINAGDRIIVFKGKEVQKKSVEEAPKTHTSYHLVSKGETLYSISRKYGVKVSELMKLNNFKSAQDLKSGMRLKIR
ncbi:LysM peptidoglycan-binding domain-containing protein [Sediminitomix flava]|uniref:Membrane-bound lytic murein transglycosylase D n=1 Tax=Sediminitomix flava TaxID=379075 RepID=A0A315ZH15_SEDFL|nr:LysM peptidoglycan-binding domain-containing protein [Sediminitomix flava]PWJ44463.1 membrane-bound lytic murein transglycosylase D [Sediminitomix flava]